MGYVLGIDVGESQTAHATIEVDGPISTAIHGGVTASAVALSSDGRAVAEAEASGSDPSEIRSVAREFVGRLGDPTPIMIGGSPYGIESLIGLLMASIMRSVQQSRGAAPGLVALAHDDDLDVYRSGLLVEAARLAGLPLDTVVLVTHSEARAALSAAGSDVAVDVHAEWAIAAGAALIALDRLVAPEPDTPHLPAAALGAAGGVTGAGGAALGATVLGDAAAAAPTAAAPGIGFTGTPLSAPGAGYTGTSLSTPGAGYTGTPVSTPGAGYTGTPLEGSPQTASVDAPASGSVRPTPRVRPRLPRIPVMVAAAAAVVVVGAATAVALHDSGTPSAAPVASTTIVRDQPATTGAPITEQATTPPETIAVTVVDPGIAALSLCQAWETLLIAAPEWNLEPKDASTRIFPFYRRVIELLPADLQPGAERQLDALTSFMLSIEAAWAREGSDPAVFSSDPLVAQAFADAAAAEDSEGNAAVTAYVEQSCPGLTTSTT